MDLLLFKALSLYGSGRLYSGLMDAEDSPADLSANSSNATAGTSK